MEQLLSIMDQYFLYLCSVVSAFPPPQLQAKTLPQRYYACAPKQQHQVGCFKLLFPPLTREILVSLIERIYRFKTVGKNWPVTRYNTVFYQI